MLEYVDQWWAIHHLQLVKTMRNVRLLPNHRDTVRFVDFFFLKPWMAGSSDVTEDFYWLRSWELMAPNWLNCGENWCICWLILTPQFVKLIWWWLARKQFRVFSIQSKFEKNSVFIFHRKKTFSWVSGLLITIKYQIYALRQTVFFLIISHWSNFVLSWKSASFSSCRYGDLRSFAHLSACIRRSIALAGPRQVPLTAQYGSSINQRHFQCPITETLLLCLSEADSSPIHLLRGKKTQAIVACQSPLPVQTKGLLRAQEDPSEIVFSGSGKQQKR